MEDYSLTPCPMLKLHTAPTDLKVRTPLLTDLFTDEEAEAILEATHEAVAQLVRERQKDPSEKPTKLLMVEGVPASMVD